MPPKFLRVINPQEEAMFKSLMPQTSEIRQSRSQVLRGCSTCSKVTTDGISLKVCSRCKQTYYCSTEVKGVSVSPCFLLLIVLSSVKGLAGMLPIETARASPTLLFRPQHKVVCSSQNKRPHKLVKSFIVNGFLLNYLQISIILALNLLQNPRPDIPIFVKLYFNVEPAYIGDVYTLLVPDCPEDVEGMLQVNDIQVSHVESPNDLPPMETELWRQYSQQEGRSRPVAIIKYIYHGDEDHAMVSPLVIQEPAFKKAEDRSPITLKSVMFGTEVILPKTCYTFLEQLNTCIRQDRTNQLLLRIAMDDVEKEVTKRAMSHEVEGEPIAVTLMRRKKDRESTYGGTQPI